MPTQSISKNKPLPPPPPPPPKKTDATGLKLANVSLASSTKGAPAPEDVVILPPGDTGGIKVETKKTPVPDDLKYAIRSVFGAVTGTMNNISSVNRSVAGALAGKDFKNINAGTIEAAFVGQVQDFFKTAKEDGERIAALGNDGSKYRADLSLQNAMLANAKAEIEKNGYDAPADLTDLLDPSAQTLYRSAVEELANSTATLAEQGTIYSKRLDEKAGELNAAWDATKKTERKLDTVRAINALFGLVVAAPGAAMGGIQFVANDISKMMTEVHHGWTALANASLVPNLFGAVTAPGLAAWVNSGPDKVAGDLSGLATSSGSKLNALQERFNKYVEEYNNQEPPDSGWYIPSV